MSAASTRPRSAGRTGSSGSRARRRRSPRSRAAAPSFATASSCRGGGKAGVGDRIEFLTPAGKRVETIVRGVYKRHGDLDQLLGQVVLSQALFDRSFPRPADLLTLVQADSTAGLEQELIAYPDAKLQTGDAFIESWTKWLTDVMSLTWLVPSCFRRFDSSLSRSAFPKTATNETSVRPIISAAAVEAVRPGFRIAFC
nr:hypothetical protein [Actinomycetota bacterium]